MAIARGLKRNPWLWGLCGWHYLATEPAGNHYGPILVAEMQFGRATRQLPDQPCHRRRRTGDIAEESAPPRRAYYQQLPPACFASTCQSQQKLRYTRP